MVQGYPEKKVVEVQVDGAPVIGHEEQSGAIDQPQPVSPGRTDHPVRIWVEIRSATVGFFFTKNLNLPVLFFMWEKLGGYAECYRSESFLLCP